MAVDQREALIAAVRAQVEKEKAEKAAKLKKEQEAMQLAGGGKTTESSSGDKPKFKTLSEEDLKRIEEKKRRKRAQELGIPYEEPEEETKQEEPSKEQQLKEAIQGIGNGLGGGLGAKDKKEEGGLGSLPTGGLGSTIGGGLGASLEPEKASGDEKVKIVGEIKKDSSKVKVDADGNKTIKGSESKWVSTEESAKTPEELDSILPQKYFVNYTAL